MPDETAAPPSAWALTYARAGPRLLEPAPAGKLRLTLLTDPWSVWCWGFEPVRRALALRYPQVEFRPLVGGMFPRLPDPREMGFDLDKFFATVQRNTGMPIARAAARQDRPESTYPACVAVHAVRLLAPEREGRFLRAMREAAYLDGLNVSRAEVAARCAEAAGVPGREFREALASGEPEREFRERLAQLHALNLHGYPTLLLTAGERTARIEGFQPLPAVLSMAEQLSARLLAPGPPPTLEDALPAGERVATREVAEALGLSLEAAFERLREEERRGALRRERLPDGDVWARP